MMCAALLQSERTGAHGRLYRASERVFDGMRDGYDRSLSLGPPALPLHAPPDRWSRSRSTSTCTSVVPKGFFPQQDTGRLTGAIQAAQDISFQAMREKLAKVVDIVRDGSGGRRRDRLHRRRRRRRQHGQHRAACSSP